MPLGLALILGHEPSKATVLRMPAGFNGRWTRRQWAHASLFASILVLLGALVPGLDQALALPQHSQRASLALPLKGYQGTNLAELSCPNTEKESRRKNY